MRKRPAKREKLYNELNVSADLQTKLDALLAVMTTDGLQHYCKLMKLKQYRKLGRGELELKVIRDHVTNSMRRQQEFTELVARRSRNKSKHAERFFELFKVRLADYMPNPVIGFDVTGFDDKVIGSGDRSMLDVIREKYGDEAVQIIQDLN